MSKVSVRDLSILTRATNDLIYCFPLYSNDFESWEKDFKDKFERIKINIRDIVSVGSKIEDIKLVLAEKD